MTSRWMHHRLFCVESTNGGMHCVTMTGDVDLFHVPWSQRLDVEISTAFFRERGRGHGNQKGQKQQYSLHIHISSFYFRKECALRHLHNVDIELLLSFRVHRCSNRLGSFFWFCLNHLIATPRQGLSKRTPLFASARGRPNVPQQEGCAQRTQKIATGRHGFFSRPSRKTMGSRFSYVSPPSSQRQYPQQEVVTWRRKAPCTDWLR